MEQPGEQRWTLLLLTSSWPERKTKYWDRVVLNRTLVTRGFFLGAAGCFGVGCRPTNLWPKAEVTRGEAARKNSRTNTFRVVQYKDFTEPNTVHKKYLGIQGNWTAVLEKIYWRCVFPMEHKLRQNRQLKIIKEKANNFHSTIKFTSIHRWDVRNGDHFLGNKNVQWG